VALIIQRIPRFCQFPQQYLYVTGFSPQLRGTRRIEARTKNSPFPRYGSSCIIAAMHAFTADETVALLPYSDLASTLAEVLRERKAGIAQAPQRLGVPLAGGGLLFLMPAADDRLAITKLVTIHTGNTAHGLPVVQADVLVMEAANGRRLFTLDGNVVTARRTAALSLLAARTLAPSPGGPLLVVGAGTQARSHVEAFVEGLGVREIYVCSRTPENAERLASYVRGLGGGITARAVSNAEEVIAEVSLVVTATTSSEPVLPADPLLSGQAFVAAVGAYTPQMAELPRSLVLRSRLFVDTVEGVRSDGGDYIQAGVDWSTVTPLQDALDLSRPDGGPIVFKSVGHALWDLAAAKLVASRQSW
jgi:1-piperideine-2-carboxylate/1-pyrroline-2-carboxylate reductase [NAD(P)H]